MIIDDFRFMWRGRQLHPLKSYQTSLLSPISVRRRNQGRALLLFHGFSSSPAVYRECLPYLTMYDAVICPVLPGHGDSIQSFSQSRASDWITAAEESCHSLIKQYEQVDVMGLSLGGLLACHLSTRFDLHHLYLLAPALALQVNSKLALTCAEILKHLGLKRLRNRAGDLHEHQHNELAYRQLPIVCIIEILKLIHEFKFISPSCPTDLFLGTFDKVVNSSKVAELFSNSPNVTTHWLKNSAHVLPLDGDLEIIMERLRKLGRGG